MLTIALATPSLFGGMSPLLELMLVPTSSAYALAQSWESLAAAEGAYRRLSILRIVQAAIVLGIQVSVGLLQPSRSEEHTSELQSLMRISYAVFCLKKKNKKETTKQIQYYKKKKQ